jgi:hypothetical protein
VIVGHMRDTSEFLIDCQAENQERLVLSWFLVVGRLLGNGAGYTVWWVQIMEAIGTDQPIL